MSRRGAMRGSQFPEIASNSADFRKIKVTYFWRIELLVQILSSSFQILAEIESPGAMEGRTTGVFLINTPP